MVPNSDQQPATRMETEITLQIRGITAASLTPGLPRVLFGGCIPTDTETFLLAEYHTVILVWQNAEWLSQTKAFESNTVLLE